MIKGIIAGSFDVIHPGYIKAFKESKKYCDYLYVFLHKEPSKERSFKVKTVTPIEDRKLILKSIKYIDDIITYQSEKDLLFLLENVDYQIRFLGDDYKDRDDYTGYELTKNKLVFLDRSHQYSTTEYKIKIYNSIKQYKKL